MNDRLVEQMAEAIHMENDRKSEPRFRVKWDDCLPAYKKMIRAEAAAALDAVDDATGDDNAIPFHQQPPEIQEEMLNSYLESGGGKPMLVFTIDRDDLPLERLEEYKRLLKRDVGH